MVPGPVLNDVPLDPLDQLAWWEQELDTVWEDTPECEEAFRLRVERALQTARRVTW